MELFTEKRYVRGVPGLFPSTALDRQTLDRLRDGALVPTVLLPERSVEHQRWYRGLVGVIAEGLGRDPHGLHCELKAKANLVENIFLAGKVAFITLESTRFPKNGGTMDEVRFREYTDLVLEIIFRQYLPGVRRRDVLERVEAMVGPRP
jgi:hypothetical protein